ncbi:hypothetical protein NKI74_26945 [Mesorhizobium sp. M0494]|uniref:hypothetical protein n=1 Tax=Mesorhizobium sp. M0494 TaxID=2956951 RepID=UPI00333D52F9
MAKRALLFSLVSVFFAAFLSASPAQVADEPPCAVHEGTPFNEAAHIKFACSSTRPLTEGASHREFALKLGALAAIATPKLSWKQIDPMQEPARYAKALLEYGIKDNQGVDWRIEDNKASTWCHAPWFQDLRERLRGMTLERGSRPFELHARQQAFSQNWAIGFYNDVACRRLALVWKDPASPKTKDFAFPDGSYAIKLLFTAAAPSEVPYLAGSLEWDAAIGEKGEVTRMRLLQVDVAVKDNRLNGVSGWFFGTFMYDAGTPGNTPYERLTPVGVTWGNDPTLTAFQYEQRGKAVRESWVNPAVAEKFFALPRHTLGLFGRLNGPVDNPKSSCIACHGQALDWGRAITRGSLAEVSAGLLMPGPPQDPYDDGVVGRYFLNLGTASFVNGTQPLDYSLQVALGIKNFRAWVFANYPQMADQATDVPKFGFPTDPFDAVPLAPTEPSMELFKR